MLSVLILTFYDLFMSYVFYNPNPKHRRTTDCVVRAIARVLDMDWNQAYINLTAYGLEQADMPDMAAVWKPLLYDHGFRTYVIPDTCPACYTVKDFCEDHPFGTYVLAIIGRTNHVVAVVDGSYFDTTDSGFETPTFYMKKE